MTWRRRHQPRPGDGISIIVPLHFDDTTAWERYDNWRWLYRFWAYALPGAEIVFGHDRDKEDGAPFSKAAAVNDGRRHAHGDVLVIADADCYINPETVLACAGIIRAHRDAGQRLWYVPYRRFYRLQPDVTRLILRSDPGHPVWPADPPEPQQIQDVGEKASSHGHWFGALIQIMPTEAFDAIRGWDERFRDWGGEDVSMMRAVDTVWQRHRTMNAPVWHLWHPTFGSVSTTRTWAGGAPGNNDWLSQRYDEAIGDRQHMLGVRRQDPAWEHHR